MRRGATAVAVVVGVDSGIFCVLLGWLALCSSPFSTFFFSGLILGYTSHYEEGAVGRQADGIGFIFTEFYQSLKFVKIQVAELKFNKLQ